MDDLSRHIAGPDYSGTVASDDPSVAEWLRMPPAGQRLFGLSRGFWYQLAEEGEIRTVSLRKKGCLRGARLFYCPDVRGYLQRNFEEQHPTTQP